MKETIKRLREYEANAKADEHFIFDFQEAAGEEMPKLLDYIEKLEAVADAAKETATRLYKYGTDRSEWESSLDRLCETLKEAGKL